MSTTRFLGYDTNENGKLVINREQAKIVQRIYDEYLSGKTVDHIQQYHIEENHEAIIDPLEQYAKI